MKYLALFFLLINVGFTSCNGQVGRENTKQVGIVEQAKTLKKYYEKAIGSTGAERAKYEKLFFEAFPTSFKRMEEIYGFDDKKGEAPLYNTGEEHINLFYNLRYIDTIEYYNKYVDICIGGKWEADNISEGFGIKSKLNNDPKKMLNVLSKRTDKEIRSVFRFIFDGPHPEDSGIKKSYEELYVKVKMTNPSMAELMKQEYEKLLRESDNHGH
jgi:hypothetical protein